MVPVWSASGESRCGRTELVARHNPGSRQQSAGTPLPKQGDLEDRAVRWFRQPRPAKLPGCNGWVRCSPPADGEHQRPSHVMPQDFDSIADELYGLRPGEFTAARDAFSVQARRAGDVELAGSVKA